MSCWHVQWVVLLIRLCLIMSGLLVKLNNQAWHSLNNTIFIWVTRHIGWNLFNGQFLPVNYMGIINSRNKVHVVGTQKIRPSRKTKLAKDLRYLFQFRACFSINAQCRLLQFYKFPQHDENNKYKNTIDRYNW